MTRNRKAELQRKLSMASLPTPPPDLARRIKDQIPGDLGLPIEHDRTRMRRSVAFDVRVAASILLLISAAFAGLQIFSRSKAPAGASRSIADARSIGSRTSPSAAIERNRVSDEPRLLPTTPPPAPRLTRQTREQAEETVLTAAAPEARSRQIADAATPIVAEPPMATASMPENSPAAPAATPPAMADLANQATAKAAPSEEKSADSVAQTPARAAAIQSPAGASSKVAGLLGASPKMQARGGSAFAQAEALVRRHEALDSDAAAAIIEHFALPASRPERSVRLETETIAFPGVEPGTLFVRVSVDAAGGKTGGSDFHLTIEPADGSPATPRFEQVVAPGAAATHVEALSLDTAKDALAIVRLRYRDPNGTDRAVERRILPTEAVVWEKATPRGRAATLAALFVRRLQEGRPLAPLAVMAHQAGLPELADLIESASR